MQGIEQQYSESKRLFSVPVSVAMLFSAQRTETGCFIDGYSVKSVSWLQPHVGKVIVLGRVAHFCIGVPAGKQRTVVTINDNTGSIRAVAYEDHDLVQVIPPYLPYPNDDVTHTY